MRMSDLNLGMSGCKIEKLSDLVIRKYSKDLDYNSRLLDQVKKQKKFFDFNFQYIYTPKILNVSESKLHYFDMDYCLGKNYNQYLSSCSVNELHFFSQQIINYIHVISQNNEFYSDEECKIILEKKLNNLKNNSNYNKLISFILDNLGIFDFDNIPKSFCHGDLTFSNMLFEENKICFIDFLDSYLESSFSDLAKLKQDLFYKWIIKKENIRDSRLEQSFEFIWKNIYQEFGSIINTNIFDLIDLINLLRIEPYVNKDQKKILIECIESHKFYVNFNNSDGRTIF
jgi:thiamine kinase-like enzyme